MITPTMNKMIRVYEDSAQVERLKCGRPSESTVRNTLAGVRVFMRWINETRLSKGYAYMGLDDNFPLVSIIKPQLIHQFLSDLLKRDIRPITAMSYVNQLRQLFAKWAMAYYEDLGWKVPSFPAFGKRPPAPRYNRPAPEKLAKVKEWYLSLPPGELWFVATMMLEFGMRNSDIMRLKRENFIERDGRVFLNYMPNKTRHSSGRMVKWPVHISLWERIKCVSTDLDLLELNEEVFVQLNQKMRSLGFNGTKGAYELRKICIDHIYQRFGAEMAVSISGDNIRTIMHYYADPAQPNIGEMRITDLL